MPDGGKNGYLQRIQSEAFEMGGRAFIGHVSRKEIQETDGIRVSVRLSSCIGSTELFTLRQLDPETDYHVMLVAVPKKNGSAVHFGTL